MKTFQILIFLVFTIFSINGQDSLDSLSNKLQTNDKLTVDSFKILYSQETIYLDGAGFTKNEESIKFGFFKKNLKAELRKSIEANQEFKLYQKYITRGFILYIGGFIGVVVVSSVTASPVGLLLFVPSFIGLSDIIKSSKHFQKSVWIYNRDMLIKRMNLK